jgi:hypothetical protein
MCQKPVNVILQIGPSKDAGEEIKYKKDNLAPGKQYGSEKDWQRNQEKNANAFELG